MPDPWVGKSKAGLINSTQFAIQNENARFLEKKIDLMVSFLENPGSNTNTNKDR